MSTRGSGAPADDAVDPERGGSAAGLGSQVIAAQSSSTSAADGGKEIPKDSSAAGLPAPRTAVMPAPVGGSSADGAAVAGGGSTDGNGSTKGCCASCLGAVVGAVVVIAAFLWRWVVMAPFSVVRWLVEKTIWAVVAWLWCQTEPARAWFCYKAKPLTDVLFYDRPYKKVFKDHLRFTGKDDGADPRDFLKNLWSAYAVVNTLMLGISMGPFSEYISKTPCADSEASAGAEQCIETCPDPDDRWRAPTLAAIWAIVVAVNAIGVGVTLLCQAHVLKVPASNQTMQAFFQMYGKILTSPSWWTGLGASVFAFAVFATAIIFITSACSAATIATITAALFLLLVSGVRAVWRIRRREVAFGNWLKRPRRTYKRREVRMAVTSSAAAQPTGRPIGAAKPAGQPIGAEFADAFGAPIDAAFAEPDGTARPQAVSASVIAALVNGLSSADEEEKADCAAALSDLAFFDVNLAAIAAGIPQLVQLLSTGSEAAQEAAATVLSSLAACSLHYAEEIASKGGMKPLVQLLGSDREAVQIAAANTLQNLAHGHATAIKQEGGIELLGQLLGNPSRAAQEAAATALSALAADGSAEVKTAIANAPGALTALVRLLSTGSDAAQEAAVRTLHILAPSNAAAIVDAGGISSIVRLLRYGSEAVQVPAAFTLRELARCSQDIQDKIAKAGGIKALQSLSTGRDGPARQAATQALRELLPQEAGPPGGNAA
ncbi:hypothetical protein ABPG75_000984 [Micractinium tetrahymenae]